MSDIGVLVTIDEESPKSKLVLDYTNRDFASIRAQLIGLAKGIVPEWNTAGEAPDLGTVILELFAYMGDVMNFYIDRTAGEAFLSTAVRPQSVLNIADMFGYVPIGQHAASVTLTFSMNESLDPNNPLTPVTLPKGTRIHNATTDAQFLIIFETQEEVTLKPGDGVTSGHPALQVFATEGITQRDVALGQVWGVPNTDLMLPEKGIIYGSVEIISMEGFQTIQWNFISDLSLARPNQTVFTTYLDQNGFTHVVFGDNSSGRIPAIHGQIFANYRYGVGALANDIAKNDLTTIIPPPDVDIIDLKVTNDSPPIGGSDPESVESLRFSIPRAASRIRSRAVTLSDYADLALQVPGVAKSVAYGTVYTAVRIRIAPIGQDQDELAMKRLCNAVDQYMADKILIGSSVLIEPRDIEAGNTPEHTKPTDQLWETIFIRIHLQVAETYNRTSVREQVETVVRKLVDYDVVDFGTRISVGDVYRAILTVSGVLYGDIRWLSPESPPEESNPEAPVSPNVPVNQPLFTGTWKYQNDSSPATGVYYVNNTSNPTTLTLSHHGNNFPTTPGRQVNINALTLGDHVVMRPTANTWAWWDLIVTGDPVNTDGSPGYSAVPVKVHHTAQTIASMPLPGVNDTVMFDFLRYNPTPVSVGNVADIITDDLKIPRIDPTEIIEDEGAVEEVQVLTPSGTITNGTFTLTVMATTTAAIAYDATATIIKAAIDVALPNNLIMVTGGPVHTTPVTLTYPIEYGNVPDSVIVGTLTGGSIATSTTTQGVPGAWVVAGFTEDERTHDGLWVVASGGLANT